MSTFSERLQQVRKEQGFSRKEIADILEITPRAYQYYEEGKREPNYDKLVVLARYLKVSSDYLLGLSDDR
ncbi:MAG: helix-turn-helix transcriptional regulator [Oscillospiraceae bacterium]|nr:helix-turn-helix transcriptional regulator [Oscillospiraceae bacterium]